MEKEIVFVEYVQNIIHLKIARAFKLKGGYKTILISFSSVDEELYKKSFDEILVLDIKHKVNPKNLLNILKKIKSKEGKEFIKRVKELKPYFFQITGPDLFTMIIMFITKKVPKVYFAYDIWAFDRKKIDIKHSGIREFTQRIIERICIKKANGVIHKGPSDELKLLSYRVNKPDLAITPGCLEEWTFAPKKKKKKELNIVFAGISLNGEVPFLDVIRIITAQNIHIHSYGKGSGKDERLFIEEERKNKYYHFHEKKRADELNKEIANYDYGINPEFYDPSILNPLFLKTTMGNRLFNYIEAGIPIILNKAPEYMSKIVEENGIGFPVSYEDLKDIRGIIKKQDPKKILENIRLAQKKFSLDKVIIPELEKFYEKVVNK